MAQIYRARLKYLRKGLKYVGNDVDHTVARVGIKLPAQAAQSSADRQRAVCWCRQCQLPLVVSSSLLFCLHFSNLSVSLKYEQIGPIFSSLVKLPLRYQSVERQTHFRFQNGMVLVSKPLTDWHKFDDICHYFKVPQNFILTISEVNKHFHANVRSLLHALK